MALIPLGPADVGRRDFPWMNWLLILANVGVFVLQVAHGQHYADCVDSAFVMVPHDLLSNIMHVPFATSCPFTEPTPVALTIFTSMFLHANLIHIGGNMLYLWAFGGNLEQRLGSLQYLVFYLVCGVFAAIAQIGFSIFAGQTDIPMLGASGAIAGVLGAYLVFFPGAKVRTVIFFGLFVIARLAAFIVIGFFILLQIAEAYFAVEAVRHGQGQAAGVAFFAHIGGFAVGFFLALVVQLFSSRPTSSASYR